MKRLTPEEIEQALPIRAETLRTLFEKGLGPKAQVDDQGNPRYELDEVVEWLAEVKDWDPPF